jgi:hypothetical protein
MPSDADTDVIATPEGDNEIPPDQPLQPAADAALDGLETPPGSGDLPYEKDKT